MTQEFVTLPREVVERAIEALFCTDSEEGSTAYENELKAVKKLRAALNQPQGDQPAMTPIAQRKLEDLVASGYTISGYSIYHKQKHQHGFVTGAGLVGWWRPDGMEYPQPKREPLTNSQINRLIADGKIPISGNPYEVFRAAEAAHNIK